MACICARLDEQHQAGGQQRKAKSLGSVGRGDNERVCNE